MKQSRFSIRLKRTLDESLMLLREDGLVEWKTYRSIKRGDRARAIQLAIDYARAQPRDLERWLFAARIQSNCGASLADREETAHTALQFNPNSARLRLLLFRVLAEQSKYAEARDLIESTPSDIVDTVPIQLAHTLLSTLDGDWALVQQALDRVVSLVTDRTDEGVVVEVILNLLDTPNRYDDAIRLLEDLVARKPDTSPPYALLSIAIEKTDPKRAAHLMKRSRRRIGQWPGFDAWVEEMRASIEDGDGSTHQA